jgi:hypothetical protein
VTGSAYSFDPVTDYERELVARAGTVVPPPSSKGPALSAGFPNVDDGYYILAVAAIDEVGNIGPAARTLLRADKFVPFTLVSDVMRTQDDLGRSYLRILGRGFREDGTISRIVLDLDGKAPYDFTFERETQGFSVDSDRAIGGLVAGGPRGRQVPAGAPAWPRGAGTGRGPIGLSTGRAP